MVMVHVGQGPLVSSRYLWAGSLAQNVHTLALVWLANHQLRSVVSRKACTGLWFLVGIMLLQGLGMLPQYSNGDSTGTDRTDHRNNMEAEVF